MPFISKTLAINTGTANAFTLVDTVMAADTQCNIYITNKSNSSGNFRLGISSSGSPGESKSILYDFPLASSGTFILNDVLVNTGEGIYLYSPSNFVIRVEGEYQTAASSAATSAPTIASAATIAPTTAIIFVSGTAAISTITAPASLGSFGNRITLIPTGVFTTVATGNIALASTAVVSRALTMTYDATTTKWYPSY